jgi:protease-4
MSEKEIENTPDQGGENQPPGWEREVIEKLAFAALNEQRSSRRWGVFFKALMFTYLMVVLGIAVYPNIEQKLSSDDSQHTAVIDIIGMIAEDKKSNAEAIIKGLRAAAKDENTKGIIIHLNTPGGSPVQSAYVYDEIRSMKKKRPDMPIYAVVSDVCASGGYYIAAAADKIYVNQASLIGSIGVLMNGFGFVDTMSKFGAERRLFTAGAHKAMLDPFSPIKEDERQHVQKLLDQVHEQFITAVKEGRGDRLKENPGIFSGLVWNGEEGVNLGLADAYGNDDYVAREVIGAKKLKNFTQQERMLDRLVGKLGASFGKVLTNSLQNFSMQ